MPLAVGERLGPYEIIEPIGAGGMGEVYKARDTRLDRIVAIKISNERFTERFEQEARAVAALNHPNICTLHDVGPNYLVMEYIEGESPKGPMPLDEALRIAHQIADALEAAHERGITHRDLKPANIKIKPDGTVKVLDFGLAKLAATTSGSGERSPTFTIGMTEAGMILGTASYMAPEQARGKSTDKRADIFAFGVVLHELITGNRLFGGEDAGEMLAKVIRDEPDLSDAPPSVQRLLSECLQKDPRKRLRDIGDVWRLLDGAPPNGVPSAPAAAAPEKRNQWLWPAVAAVLLATTAVLSFVHFRETPPALTPMRFEVALPAKTALNAFAISPDGRKLVFNARGADGRNALWLRLMDSLQAHELPGTEGVNLDPTWSPDSQSIAFLADGNLKRIDISGGTPQILAPCTNPATGISWSRDDVILFGRAGMIHRIPASGGEATPITALDSAHGEAGVGRPSFLPDGKHFFYYRLMGNKSGIYTGSIDAKPAQQGQTRLLDTPAGVEYVPSPAGKGGYLFFLRGTALMAQPFDAGRLELTGRAVQLADQVSTNLFDGLFSVSNNGCARVRHYRRRQPAIDLVRPAGKSVGPRRGTCGARRTRTLARWNAGRRRSIGQSGAVGGVDAGCSARRQYAPYVRRRRRQRSVVTRWPPNRLCAHRWPVAGSLSKTRQRCKPGRIAVALRWNQNPDGLVCRRPLPALPSAHKGAKNRLMGASDDGRPQAIALSGYSL